jgi:chromosome segregation ATPase
VNSSTEGGPHGDAERVAELESELEDLETELEAVEAELDEVEAERADLREDRDALRQERDRLREERDELREERDALERERDELQADVDDLEDEVESLESQLEQLESQYGAKTDAETRLTPQEALDQTNLFIRYESKGRATLETAHDGNASRDEVNENLGLEYHTQFDAASASVGGEAFDAFLTDTIEYRFVSWVIHHLLYEIRDTGKIAAMKDLYDAIPRIDRAELNGEITAEFTEDGQERRTQESFDVVLRDRMGNALIVANLNDSRQAATESMLSSLVTASSRVGEGTETLAASFQVTSSFFEPEALETTSEATSGGLLSRDKRQSFVKLTRKQGYHLCLVEAREGKFHLAVPEL